MINESENTEITGKLKKVMDNMISIAAHERNALFVEHLKGTHPEMDVDLAIQIFDEEIETAKNGMPAGADNKDMRFPLGNDLNKNIFICVIDRYLKEKNNKTT